MEYVAISLHVKNEDGLPKGEAADVPPFFDNIMEQCVRFKPQERLMFRDILLMIVEGEKSLNL